MTLVIQRSNALHYSTRSRIKITIPPGMSSAMEILWKQAAKTFAGRRSVGYQLCQKNFEKLRYLINEIRAEDVNVDKGLLDFIAAQCAPMCSMVAFEDQNMTIALFFLQHGVTMPMHDHPGMHGLLKVLCGTVKINSYTVDISQDHLIKPGEVFTATKHPAIVVDNSYPASVLTPKDKNFHEISCIEGPAVFLDILSPPYVMETDIDDTPFRPCTYFREIVTKQSEESIEKPCKVQLAAMLKPPKFHTRCIQYVGSPLG